MPDDVLLRALLSLIEQDMDADPRSLRPLSSDLLSRAATLTEGVTIDRDGHATP